MTPEFITLSRFSVYFEINLATTALENVATIYRDSVGTSLCVHFCVPLLLETVTKIQNQGMRNEGTGRRKFLYL